MTNLEQAAQQAQEFHPDWDTQAVLVEEMQRMAKRIEDLEAMLESQTAPAQPAREWVGLTDVEVGDALIELPILGNGYFLRIAKAIEAALKEKNT